MSSLVNKYQMKPIPIKVQIAKEVKYYDITWKLHNVCTYDCSFCGPEYKGGTERWLSLEENKLIFDKIYKAANGKLIWMMFSGGEPTLYPDFIELAKYIKSKNCYLGVISNGTRSLRWWEEIRNANVLDNVMLTLHPDQGGDPDHIAEILNLFIDQSTATTCWITSTKESIDKAITAHILLKKKTGAVLLLKPMNIAEYQLKDYFKPQHEIYLKRYRSSRGDLWSSKKQTGIPKEMTVENNQIDIVLSDGTVIRSTTQEAIHNSWNRFKGWNCNIGEFQAFIDRHRLQRGACFHTKPEYINLLEEDARFISDPIVCPNESCFCGSDLISTKYRDI